MMKQIFIACFVCLFSLADAQTPELRLQEMGIVLPQVSQPAANYVKYVRSGNLIFLSGHISQSQGGVITGKLGGVLSVDSGYVAARWCGIQLLATLKAALGDLSKVKRVVKVLGMVSSTPSFTEQHKVMNGFSDLMVAVFGEKGRHARSAVGMVSLPLDAAVEIEMIVEVEE